jgi:very-short-patch-repair endonuclease
MQRRLNYRIDRRMRLHNLKFNKEVRRYLRKNLTRAEVILWQRLKRKQLGFKFRRQHGIGPYVVDFYCAKLNLIIELDGTVHGIREIKLKDKIRQEFLENNGFVVKRYNNSMVFQNISSVILDIYNTCMRLTSLSPSLGRRAFRVYLESPPKIRGRLQRGLV